MATGDVYQIKGYGKIDKKKCAGNIYAPLFDGAVLFRDRFRHGRFDNRNCFADGFVRANSIDRKVTA
jgi:hypothetical protein